MATIENSKLKRRDTRVDQTMKSLFARKVCTSCSKLSEAFVCRGCKQTFCAKHVRQHRDKITKDMNNIVVKCERIRDDSKTEKFAQPLLQSIEKWEKESLEKIRTVAQSARSELRPWIDEVKAELEAPLKTILDELQLRRKLQDYTEVDMKRWNEELKGFNDRLKQKPIIENLYYEDTNGIHFLRIMDRLTATSSRETYPTNSISEPSIDNSHESPSLEREAFGEMYGAITLSDNDHTATYSGPWNGDANLCGTNQYSVGVHNLRFRIAEKFYNAPFFGVTSASQPMIEHMLSAQSTNGWLNFDFPIINGVEERTGKDRLLRTGDDVTLTIDCDRRQILFRHIRSDRLLQLPIDTRLCPFPWKLLIVLRRRGDSIRLLGGSIGLTTMDILEKFPEQLDT